jgi:enamine deaminase RidA (YjgF/YER057c/UK114 family)
VFRLVSYHPSLNNEAVEIMVRELKKWTPGHKPIWTCIGVEKLAEEEMKIEIEVVAHDP